MIVMANNNCIDVTNVQFENYTKNENYYDYITFEDQHIVQLKNVNIPEQFWKPLYTKLTNQIFDAGNNFKIYRIECDDENDDYRPLTKVILSSNSDIMPQEGEHIYLVDHAWTYDANKAGYQLRHVDGLLNRLGDMMGISKDLQIEDRISKVLKKMWKFNLTFCFSGHNIEDRIPLWYIMDEFGSAIQHSDNPNFRIVPFLYLTQGITYSLLFPIKTVQNGEEVTRDFAEGIVDGSVRKSVLLPWNYSSFRHISFIQEVPPKEYFLSGRISETLPNLPLLDMESAQIDNDNVLKVYSNYEFINQYLTHPRFQLTNDENEADILWVTYHFKDYKQFSEAYSHKFINQFPFENVITIKDLLSVVCQCKYRVKGETFNINTLETYPSWLPTTFNLNTELTKFISYFQHRQDKGLDNFWICKPYNLARGLDILITDNLDCLVRLPTSGPKIAQKYVSKPVLFNRPDCGMVKFDIRYVTLLKSIKPLKLYVYKHFFLRFANEPFELNEFEKYEKHFTVMNYSHCPLYHVRSEKFISQFNNQYPSQEWRVVEPKILLMFREVFEAATTREPPCGIAESPQSRALYAVDLILEVNKCGKFAPKLLEVNWTPDCQRACEYYPDFYNDVFSLLFLNEDGDNFYLI